MPTPRVLRLPRDQRRAQLLEAASEVFAAKGYHFAAMDDIADAAGVSKPVLYQHFTSKLDLYLDLLDASANRLVQVVRGALASTTDNAERVVATMGAFYDFVADSDSDFRFVFESDLTGEVAVQERLDRINDEISEAIATVIAEDTGLPPAQARLLGVCLVGIAQVSARYWVAGDPGSREDETIGLEEAKHLVSTLVWRGVRGFPRTDQRSTDQQSTEWHSRDSHSTGHSTGD